MKAKAGIKGRWHDNRHTFITDLAESGEAADETIEQLAGHVSQRRLKHYYHIRTQAKRRAVDSLVAPVKATEIQNAPQNGSLSVGVPIH